MVKIQQSFFVAAILAASAHGDMMMTISYLDDGVLFEIDGSINIDVFPSRAGLGTSFPSFTALDSSIDGVVSSVPLVRTEFLSHGDGFFGGLASYRFENASAMTPIGQHPGILFSDISAPGPAPEFLFGYTDITAVDGVPEGAGDRILVPRGYESSTIVDLSYFEPSGSLFFPEPLLPGAFWGVSFTDGQGGQQSLTFRVVPEPSALELLFPMLMLLFVGPSVPDGRDRLRS